MKASQLVKYSLVDIDASETVENAIRQLINHNVSCLPVKTSENNKTVYRGLFEWRHAIPYLISQSTKLNSIDELKVSSPKEQPTLLQEMDLDILCQSDKDVPLEEAIRMLANSGAHQLYIPNHGIISQTDILDHLQNTLPNVPLKVVFQEKAIHSIKATQPVKDALSVMYSNGVSSCPVLDHDELIGNISVGDLRKIACGLNFTCLTWSASHFIKQVKYDQMIQQNGQDSFPVFQLSIDQSLEHAVKLMLVTKTHRVWLTNPFGIVSMSDVIRYLSETQ